MGITKFLQRVFKSWLPKTKDERFNEIAEYFDQWGLPGIAEGLLQIEQWVGMELSDQAFYAIRLGLHKGRIDSHDLRHLFEHAPVLRRGFYSVYHSDIPDGINPAEFYMAIIIETLNEITI